MVLASTPRTEDAPPAPDSQILPTPGHSPLVAGDELASVRAGETEAPACEVATSAAGPAALVATSQAGASVSPARTLASSSPATNGEWPGVGKICESGAGGASSVRGVEANTIHIAVPND